MMGKENADFVLLPPVAVNGITAMIPRQTSRGREWNPEEHQADGTRSRSISPVSAEEELIRRSSQNCVPGVPGWSLLCVRE